MIRANRFLDTAAAALRLAATYAEDGAVSTALSCCDEARTALQKEAERRRAIGMMPPAATPQKKGRRRSA